MLVFSSNGLFPVFCLHLCITHASLTTSNQHQVLNMDHLQEHHFDPRLRSHIKAIDLQGHSHLSSSRLRDNAIPNIGLIEIVSGSAFEESYSGLYCSMFHGAERERPDLIIQRLADDFAGLRGGLAPYRIVGLRDTNGEAIGAAQFSVLTLQESNYTVPYVQYIYVRAQNRRQDLSEVLHTIVLAVATADAGEGRTVPFTPIRDGTTRPRNNAVESSERYRTDNHSCSKRI